MKTCTSLSSASNCSNRNRFEKIQIYHHEKKKESKLHVMKTPHWTLTDRQCAPRTCVIYGTAQLQLESTMHFACYIDIHHCSVCTVLCGQTCLNCTWGIDIYTLWGGSRPVRPKLYKERKGIIEPAWLRPVISTKSEQHKHIIKEQINLHLIKRFVCYITIAGVYYRLIFLYPF